MIVLICYQSLRAQCELRWNPASVKSHFENVDSLGNVFIVNKMGKLPILNGRKSIPIFYQLDSQNPT